MFKPHIVNCCQSYEVIHSSEGIKINLLNKEEQIAKERKRIIKKLKKKSKKTYYPLKSKFNKNA